MTDDAGIAISREELRRRLHDPTLAIVNVLPEAAFLEARIPGSIHLPVRETPDRALRVLRVPSFQRAEEG